MSLVGPRPVIPYELDYYTPEMMERFTVKPGLTGLWQVSGRAALDYRDMVRKDIEYASRWTLGLDCKILWKTVGVVFDPRSTE
jgi:lipopolysaccharide/colanic/teichoic acid biosynthesis glycosyltransferase